MLPIGLIVLASASYFQESRRGGFGMSVADDIFGHLASDIRQHSTYKNVPREPEAITDAVVQVWNSFVQNAFGESKSYTLTVDFDAEEKKFKQDGVNIQTIMLPSDVDAPEWGAVFRALTLVYWELVGFFDLRHRDPECAKRGVRSRCVDGLASRYVLHENTPHTQYVDVLRAVFPRDRFKSLVARGDDPAMLTSRESLIDHRNRPHSSGRVVRGAPSAWARIRAGETVDSPVQAAVATPTEATSVAKEDAAPKTPEPLPSRPVPDRRNSLHVALPVAAGLAGVAAVGLGARALARKKVERRRVRARAT